jgi:hypothetical protein
VATALGCSRDWTRTSNLPVNSRLLCQLSYAGSFCSSPIPEDRIRLAGSGLAS